MVKSQKAHTIANLNKHKFQHDPRDSVTAMYNCDTETETMNHFLCCQFYILWRKVLSTICHIFPETFNVANNDLVILMLYLSNNGDGDIKNVLETTVRYIDDSNLRVRIEKESKDILFFFFTKVQDYKKAIELKEIPQNLIRDSPTKIFQGSNQYLVSVVGL